MGNDIDVIAVMRLLGRGNEHPTVARRHRSTLATKHVFDAGARWQWRQQDASYGAVAGLVFADTPLRVCQGSEAIDVAVGHAVFLHPHRQVTLEATVTGEGTALWMPWDSLQEVEDGVQSPGQIMESTPLAAGLHAFLTSLVTQSTQATLYTDYLVERVVVEMAFGVLLESVPKAIDAAREGRLTDRARSLMLIRRTEPDFGVAELAQDLHMSTRHLQRLFAAEGTSPADELRGMRVELANELLGDPTYDALGVADVAMHAGFRTTAAMRRAFSARGLPLPGKMRGSQSAANA